ncbi:hypothetical protein KMZ30_07435 [Phycicoccus sp. KQZ13P-1]|uniref:hypothetical protein n=1 Tax=Phycicoccus mangrovi TaxID=2840470 RepID=UPI001C000103|nr:hypothetical protein [Phycicoccus mangrovi]MBT9255404.1 hypothetical protein [Phycicoccus mangrovi]
MTEALFDAGPFLVEHDEPAEELSADRRRTLRQRAEIANGRHPLAGAPLHAQAPTDPAPGGRPLPFTCGTCSHRQTHRHNSRSYQKCDLVPVTNGPGTDLRLWWPACINYDDTPKAAR